MHWMAVRERLKRWWVIGNKKQLRHGFAVIDVVPLAAGFVLRALR
jgi:hypothetical protein